MWTCIWQYLDQFSKHFSFVCNRQIQNPLKSIENQTKPNALTSAKLLYHVHLHLLLKKVRAQLYYSLNWCILVPPQLCPNHPISPLTVALTLIWPLHEPAYKAKTAEKHSDFCSTSQPGWMSSRTNTKTGRSMQLTTELQYYYVHLWFKLMELHVSPQSFYYFVSTYSPFRLEWVACCGKGQSFLNFKWSMWKSWHLV